MTINPDGRRQSLGAIPGSREPDPCCTGSGPSGFDPEREERSYRSLYEPATGRIACVLMQAVYRLDRAPCGYFGSGDWNTGLPHKSAAPFTATESQWRWLGSITREERVERFAALASAIPSQRADDAEEWPDAKRESRGRRHRPAQSPTP